MKNNKTIGHLSWRKILFSNCPPSRTWFNITHLVLNSDVFYFSTFSKSIQIATWTQSQKDNRNNLIQHLDRREANRRLHSVSNKTWAKCPASFSSGFWSASIQKEPPPLSLDFVTHSASVWDFLEAVLHLFCSDQSVAKVLAECTRKAGGQPERPSMLQTLQPQY